MQKFMITIAVILLATVLTVAKDWNGISPLTSTRAEVIKLLGEPKPPNHEVLGEHFAIDGEDVYIMWIRADCRDEEHIIAGTPPTGLNVVVKQTMVDPKSFLTSEDVKKIDPPRESTTIPGFTVSGSNHCFGSDGKWLCSVSNDERGFGYSINTERQVNRLYYFAPAEKYAAWREKTTPCKSKKNLPDKK